MNGTDRQGHKTVLSWDDDGHLQGSLRTDQPSHGMLGIDSLQTTITYDDADRQTDYVSRIKPAMTHTLRSAAPSAQPVTMTKDGKTLRVDGSKS